MRVMLDTNILVSALLFPSKQVNILFEELVLNHTIVISTFVIDEFYDVIQRKLPDKLSEVKKMMASMSYEIVCTPKHIYIKNYYIRDFKDYPVVYTALLEKVEILLTGDQDLTELKFENLEILTPAQFREKYINFKD